MPNQGVVLLGTLVVVAVGLVLIVGGVNAFLRSEPKTKRQPAKPVPANTRADGHNDRLMYDKINRLVTFFVAQMRQGRPAGKTMQRPRWIPSQTMRSLMPRSTSLPLEITAPRGAWWGGPKGYCCITPEGQWEYQGACESHREGSWDEFDAWWVVSSQYFNRSVTKYDPYPFNMYSVLNVGTATLTHALQTMGDMMEQLLTRYRPHAVAEFQKLRRQ